MSQHYATEPLYVSRGVRAYDEGDPVPADAVKRHGWEKKTRKSAPAPAATPPTPKG